MKKTGILAVIMIIFSSFFHQNWANIQSGNINNDKNNLLPGGGFESIEWEDYWESDIHNNPYNDHKLKISSDNFGSLPTERTSYIYIEATERDQGFGDDPYVSITSKFTLSNAHVSVDLKMGHGYCDVPACLSRVQLVDESGLARETIYEVRNADEELIPLQFMIGEAPRRIRFSVYADGATIRMAQTWMAIDNLRVNMSSISSVIPNRWGNMQPVAVSVYGHDFVNDISVKLVRSGQFDIVGNPIIIGNGGTSISTVFNLTGRLAGFWDIVVIKPDDTLLTLHNGFEITEGGADIRVVKTGTTAVPGRTLEYFITVQNAGTETAKNVEIFELLNPSHFTLVSADPEPMYDIQTLSNGSMVIWNIPSLPAGAIQTLSYKAILNANIPFGTSIIGGPVCSNSDAAMGCIFGMPTIAVCAGAFHCFKGCSQACLISGVPACILCYLTCAGTVGVGCAISVYSWIKDCTDAFGSCSEHETPATGPIDPNEKMVLPQDYIRPDDFLTYAIHYENIGEIEALDVFIEEELDPMLDDTTLEILTPGASYDPSKRKLRWSLIERNLQPRETDHVLFRIKPIFGLSTGDAIRNTALIQFEVFEPIETNEVVNVVDDEPPLSNVNQLPIIHSTPSFTVNWTGNDFHSGVKTFSIFVSDNSMDFISWLTDVAYTSATFTGIMGHTYSFYSCARDNVGNQELAPNIPDTTTKLDDSGNDESEREGGSCLISVITESKKNILGSLTIFF